MNIYIHILMLYVFIIFNYIFCILVTSLLVTLWIGVCPSFAQFNTIVLHCCAIVAILLLCAMLGTTSSCGALLCGDTLCGAWSTVCTEGNCTVFTICTVCTICTICTDERFCQFPIPDKNRLWIESWLLLFLPYIYPTYSSVLDS